MHRDLVDDANTYTYTEKNQKFYYDDKLLDGWDYSYNYTSSMNGVGVIVPDDDDRFEFTVKNDAYTVTISLGKERVIIVSKEEERHVVEVDEYPFVVFMAILRDVENVLVW